MNTENSGNMSVATLEKIDKKLEEFGTAVKSVQDRLDKGEDKLDGVDKEVIQKASEDAAKSLQSIQDIQAKHASFAKSLEIVQKQALRPEGGGGPNSLESEYFEKFSAFMRHGTLMDKEFHLKAVDEHVSMLKGYTLEAKDLIKKDLVSGINPQGGFFIQPERSSQMVRRIFETSPIRQVANIMTTTTNEVELVIDDNEADDGGWVGETQTRPVTGTPDIGLLKIPVHEIFSQPPATQKMLDDAGFDIEGWLAGKVQRKISRSENTAFVSGDGNLKPKGFTTFPDWAVAGVYERGAIEQIPSGGATTITTDGIIDVQGSLIEEYQASAVWLMKRATFTEVIKLKDGEDRYLINFDLLREGTDRILLGQRILFANDFTGPTAPGVFPASALPIAYGDFGVGYTIVDRFGFRVLRDEFTQKPFVLFYTTKRTGGTVTNFEAIKLQVIST